LHVNYPINYPHLSQRNEQLTLIYKLRHHANEVYMLLYIFMFQQPRMKNIHLRIRVPTTHAIHLKLYYIHGNKLFT